MATRFEEKYQLLELIGEGGMCTVHKARQLLFDRIIAIKILRHTLAESKNSVERFVREARNCAKLQHENIVDVYEVNRHKGTTYIAMQFIDGSNLRQKMTAGISLEEAVAVAIQVAAALACAHEANILHRDLKPANILLTTDGRVKVSDWGLSKSLDGSQNLTHPGIVLGTPEYMSPEQITSQPLTSKSDLYSLGVILYEMFASKLPNQAESITDILQAILHKDAPPVEIVAPHVPRPLGDLVDSLLEKKPHRRPASAHVVRENLKYIAANLSELSANVISRTRTLEMDTERGPQADIAIQPHQPTTSPHDTRPNNRQTVSISQSEAKASTPPPHRLRVRKIVQLLLLACVLMFLGYKTVEQWLPLTLAPQPNVSPIPTIVEAQAATPTITTPTITTPTITTPTVTPQAIACNVSKVRVLRLDLLSLHFTTHGMDPIDVQVFDALCRDAPPLFSSSIRFHAKQKAKFQKQLEIPHALHGSAILVVGSQEFAIDPGDEFDELFSCIDLLEDKRLGWLLQQLDAKHVTHAMTVLPAKTCTVIPCPDEILEIFEQVEINSESLSNLERWLPRLASAWAHSGTLVAQRLTPLRFAEAVLAGHQAIAPPWGSAAAACGIHFEFNENRSASQAKRTTLDVTELKTTFETPTGPSSRPGRWLVAAVALEPGHAVSNMTANLELSSSTLETTYNQRIVLSMNTVSFPRLSRLTLTINQNTAVNIFNTAHLTATPIPEGQSESMRVTIQLDPIWLRAGKNLISLEALALPYLKAATEPIVVVSLALERIDD